MALTGQLSDLSLAELIEFFCNQRKTGRLKVVYQDAPGYFYIHSGSLVDAKIGSLTGVEAVYYALSRPNASFKFTPSVETRNRTIYQPWAQVILEGLRRMDEGILTSPNEVFPKGVEAYRDDPDLAEGGDESAGESVAPDKAKEAPAATAPLPLTVGASESGRKKALIFGAVGVAVVVIIAAIAIPMSLSSGSNASTPPPAAAPPAVAVPETASNPEAQPSSTLGDTPTEESAATQPEVAPPSDLQGGASAHAARREREARERARAARANASSTGRTITTSSSPTAGTEPARKTDAAKAGPKVVTVQVTYDESGRVTQASGSDGTALRIARQKRFPAGKAGSTTLTIPIN